MSLTYQEIKGQYVALEQTVQYIDNRFADVRNLFVTENPKEIIFIGCGSSYSLAVSAAAIAQMHNSTARAIAAGDLLLHASRYAPGMEGALLVILSRSGATSEAVMAVETLKKHSVRFSLLSMTCVASSPLAALSDITLEMPWAFDHSVCQTRTVTCLYAAVACLMLMVANKNQEAKTDMEKAISGGPAYMNRIESGLRDIAALPWQKAVVLGDAEIAGLCEEGALAFKEICRLPSGYHHVLDYRHGPMVLLDTKTLVIIALSDPDSSLEMALVKEIRDKGASVVLYSDTPAPLDGVTNIVFGEKLAHMVRGIPFIVICQLLACFKAEHSGVDPDQPEGLTPWISL